MSRSITSSILSLLASKISSVVAGIVFVPILVRILGPEQYGMYATILSIIAVADIAIGSGLNDSIRKYLSEDRSTDWKNRILSYHFRIGGILMFIFSVLFLAAAWSGLVAQVLGEGFVPLFVLLPVLVFGLQLREFTRRVLHGLKLEKYSETLKIVYSVTFYPAALLLVYLGHGVTGILVANAVVSIATAGLALLVISRHLDVTAVLSRPQISIPKRRILKYAGGTAAYFACLSSLYHIDVLMLTWWTNSTTVGFYKGALAIAETLWILPKSVQMSMLQSTSEYWQNDNSSVISRVSTNATRGVALLTVLCAVGLAVLADSFVPLFLGQDFTPAVTPLLYLLPGVVGFAIARPVIAITQASGRTRPLILGTLTAAVINLAANALLIPRYGMVGAAVGTSLGYGTLPLSQAAAARYIGYSPFAGLRVTRLVITAASTSVVIDALDSYLSNPIVSLLVVPPVGLLCFAVVAVLIGAVTAEDRRLFWEKIENWSPVFERDTTGRY
ncbi:oligosaccharide flippase family protein [Halorubrum ezzemoulense]|uniref:oligosaccharide flippase family protein n=1 Tax=Halorubrum ezzemoulense TaxID=337243 RepID=UPI00232E99C2|nr:oligosaccharide flippase family protein [Halorubrum ezzemoulense]MDB2226203.1 oligosaccharide flippase family protein [Halorubrum ezzemoulense]